MKRAIIIGATSGIVPVKTHVRNILLKLEVDSRMRAVKKAKELGLT